MEIKSSAQSFNSDLKKTPTLLYQRRQDKSKNNSIALGTPFSKLSTNSPSQMRKKIQPRNIVGVYKMEGSPEIQEKDLSSPDLSPIHFLNSPEDKINNQRSILFNSSEINEFYPINCIGPEEEKNIEKELTGNLSYEFSSDSSKNEYSLLNNTISVATILKKLKLEVYESLFEKIDFHDFIRLDDNDLFKMGIESEKDREKILKFAEPFSTSI